MGLITCKRSAHLCQRVCCLPHAKTFKQHNYTKHYFCLPKAEHWSSNISPHVCCRHGAQRLTDIRRNLTLPYNFIKQQSGQTGSLQILGWHNNKNHQLPEHVHGEKPPWTFWCLHVECMVRNTTAVARIAMHSTPASVHAWQSWIHGRLEESCNTATGIRNAAPVADCWVCSNTWCCRM